MSPLPLGDGVPLAPDHLRTFDVFSQAAQHVALGQCTPNTVHYQSTVNRCIAILAALDECGESK